MRTLVHLSDLHFGRIDPVVLPRLVEFIHTVKPDVVAISGDLTQRARTAEFIEAREFLASIPFPQVVVPGNHDVPLHNIFARFARSLDRYTRYINADLQPSYADSEIIVAGVNTARAWTWKDGRINSHQLEKLRALLQAAPSNLTKIVVTHHPFDLPAGAVGRVVGRSQLAMKTLAECRVDLLLAGHFHIADTGQTAKRYNRPGYSAIIVSAGTSTSTRGRGQPNSFNIIRVQERDVLAIERRIWRRDSRAFDVLSVERFHRSEGSWIRA
jgi:3',5'-cyclic AMP phosphodiesterase CpdA